MDLNLSLKGKHALVCGASKGLGRAAALALARLGSQVTVLARSQGELARLVPELEAAGAPKAHYLALDLENSKLLTMSIKSHLDRFDPIQVLVNNAGGPPSAPLIEAQPEDFLKAFQRHLLAAHTLVQLLLPGMEQAGYGRIINIISTSVREPIVGLGVSNTLRGAMAAWAKTLAKELPVGITVNNVLPGYTDTQRLAELGEVIARRSGQTIGQVREGWLATIPEGRLGWPEELGAVVAFLASPAAAYIRGVSLPVDGGRLNSI